MPPAYGRDWSEPQGEEVLWRAARRHLRNRPLEVEAPGDILLFRMCAVCVAKHLGVAPHNGAGARFIQAYSGHAGVESPLSLAWRRRIVARVALPEGDF